jgi:hypothetical protein
MIEPVDSWIADLALLLLALLALMLPYLPLLRARLRGKQPHAGWSLEMAAKMDDLGGQIYNTTYVVGALMGGLEGRVSSGCPSKISSFRLVWPVVPATPGEIKDLRERHSRPRTPTT